jgi:hypothetical protein
MFREPHIETSSSNLGEVREREAAFRCETIFARFPHANPPPTWGRGNDAPLSSSRVRDIQMRGQAS